jgi:hypothetical protein
MPRWARHHLCQLVRAHLEPGADHPAGLRASAGHPPFLRRRPPNKLPALFDRSLKVQDEVTDAFGEQVRRAVEVLIQSLDKADQDRNRELLRDVKRPPSSTRPR